MTRREIEQATRRALEAVLATGINEYDNNVYIGELPLLQLMEDRLGAVYFFLTQEGRYIGRIEPSISKVSVVDTLYRHSFLRYARRQQARHVQSVDKIDYPPHDIGYTTYCRNILRLHVPETQMLPREQRAVYQPTVQWDVMRNPLTYYNNQESFGGTVTIPHFTEDTPF